MGGVVSGEMRWGGSDVQPWNGKGTPAPPPYSRHIPAHSLRILACFGGATPRTDNSRSIVGTHVWSRVFLTSMQCSCEQSLSYAGPISDIGHD